MCLQACTVERKFCTVERKLFKAGERGGTVVELQRSNEAVERLWGVFLGTGLTPHSVWVVLRWG